MAMTFDEIVKHFQDQKNQQAMVSQAPEEQDMEEASEPEQKDAQNLQSPSQKIPVPEPDENNTEEESNISPVPKLSLAQERLQSLNALNANTKAAQDARDREILVNQLGKSANMIGGGLAGAVSMGQVIKPDNSIYDENIKLADRHINDLKTNQDMQVREMARQKLIKEAEDEDKLRDPSNEISQTARDGFEATTGKKLSDKVSAMDLKNIGLNITSLVNAKQLADARKEVAEARAKQAAETTSSKQKIAEDNQTNKDFINMGNKATAEIASSRGAFGKSALVKQDAEKIKAMVAGRDLNDLDNREITELAMTLNRVLTQGSPTVSGMEHLIPKTAQGSVARLEEYLTNERQSADAGSFVKQMLATVDREHELAIKQMHGVQKNITANYSHLQKKDPDRYQDTLKRFGIDDESLGNADKLYTNQTSGLVRIRDKKSGITKNIPSTTAASILQDPNFEQVQ